MSNKTQLQENNTNLQNIITTIAGLPTANEVKNGLYVWKKSELIPPTPVNITIEQITDGTDPTVWQLSSSDIDLSTVDNNFFDGLTGDCFAAIGSTNELVNEFSFSLTTFYWGNSSYSYTYDPKLQRISIVGCKFYQPDYRWVFDTIQPTPTFIEYVVSDKENEYPDGATHTDGFYYKKVIDGFPLELFGCTKYAVDIVTFTSRNMDKVNHSLGEKPKLFLFMTDSETGFAANSNYPTTVEAFAYASPQWFKKGLNNGPGYMLYTTTDKWGGSQYQYYYKGYFYEDSVGVSASNNYYNAANIPYILITMA